MRRSTRSIMCLGALLGFELAALVAMDGDNAPMRPAQAARLQINETEGFDAGSVIQVMLQP